MYATVTNFIWGRKPAAPITTAASTASTAPATPSQQIKPVITTLPANGSKATILDYTTIAIFIEANKEIQVWDFQQSKLTFPFKCDYPVKKLYGFNRLFAQFEGDPQVKAWELYAGKPEDLPETWKKVDFLSFGRDFVCHSVPQEKENQPITLHVSSPYTLQLKHTISTEFFKIHSIVESARKIYMTGLDSNPKSHATPKSGFMIGLEGIGGKKIEWYKRTFTLDSTETPCDALKVEQGFIYNTKWTPALNYVWDEGAYAPVLARKAVKAADQATLTCVLGYTIAIADSKEIAIYKVVGEAGRGRYDRPEFYQYMREEQITSVTGTKVVSPPKSIEIPQGNSLNCLHLFNTDDDPGTAEGECLMVEGYANGLVKVRSLEDFRVKMEFQPPQDMKKVISCQTYFTSNKLLVHYGSPSSEGTLAIVWDLKEQKPFLLVTRDALKNRKYDSSQDLVKLYDSSYADQGNLVVQSEDQILYYEGIFKCDS